ncbi:hypothetical protein ATL40_2290 [Serinibacter salmoneus]|uniref:HTH cro/C1-type domain-containing protein n=1 Tax=Serinibacter salmoneus TaxID=556530 RepID=A0A2A9D498_9MICO|nr:hypothetical protein ATL40_2290 [Serinibacter salmoneus]
MTAAIARRYHGSVEATELRERRHQRGLTQRALARLADVPQPNIAAYETGRRRPDPATSARLDRALRAPALDSVRRYRHELERLAEARHLTNLRVFGSLARGQGHADSDVDLLVTPSAEASLFDLAGFQDEAAALLGVPVDVVSDRGSAPFQDRIRAEAVPL